jgi:hypothetical protein
MSAAQFQASAFASDAYGMNAEDLKQRLLVSPSI